ncbi:radical SAM protein [Methanotrichaceae archaeon M04Ac]|uniref:Radical SAM protein n=1 Tax=Candidatus Methanocrinis alkalitolerans TaxID=3033395 RepID=A0ABT5XBC0_9EURY|nr:radical SAM protein [Candidatus Methanocrinis alkalitolerans]MCR3883201.1 radical SAM protein [Methanothrix sp.]MDF0592010.1 radical SAM protein [Candidatus Methanocrinis alkalitolerans]
MTPLLKTTALTVEYDQDKRILQARGAISMLVQPALNKINRRLAEEKPALVREGDIVASTWLPPIPSGPFKRLVLSEAKIAIGRFVPQTVSIEVTRECGCSCHHCLIKEGEGELEAEEIQKVVDEALDLGASIITFTEGDPLLRDDIFELIRYVDPERAVVNLFTPGLEMTPDKAKRLKEAGLYNLLIGVYSTDPTVHDGIRGVPGAHEKAIEAIKMALDAGLLVTISVHVKGDGVSGIFDLYDLATDLGVHELSIWEGMPRSPDEGLTQIERESILRFYRKVNATPGGPRVFANTYFEGEMLGCMAGRRWIHVGVDGGVRPCPYIGEVVGNVRDRPLKDIWKDIRRSGEFDAFRSDCPAQSLHLGP